jgi:hypothetical protein
VDPVIRDGVPHAVCDMMTSSQYPARPGWRINAALWFGMLAGPISALAMQLIDYMIIPKACAYSDDPLWRTLLHVVPAIFLAMTAFAGFTAWRYRRAYVVRVPEGQISSHTARIHFMADVGVWLTLLSILVLIAQWIPVFIFHPCLHS